MVEGGLRVMDGFCGMGRVRICVVLLELDDSEDDDDDDDDDEDEDEDEGGTLPSSHSGSSSEAITTDSEDDDCADGEEDVLPSDSDPVLGSDELGMEGEAFLPFDLGGVTLCDVREPSGRRACSVPFSRLVVGGGFEEPLSSGELSLFVAVAIEADLI